MAEKNETSIFNRLTNFFGSPQTAQQEKLRQPVNPKYSNGGLYAKNGQTPNKGKTVIATAKDARDKELQIRQLKQERMLSMQWHKAAYDIAMTELNTANDVKVMYRDANLMDYMPEIGTALDIMAEEVCTPNREGFILNVESKSERIKKVLQDLFLNRLQVNMTLPMIARAVAKYGNNYMLLNFDSKRGVIGWKQLPVEQIERYENGMTAPYEINGMVSKGAFNDFTQSGETWFSWVGSSQISAYRNWQIAHFRLLYDSIMLPYGCSVLNKARRHFRMLSMMEDAMLLYRMDKSVERRVYKINVGAMDEADVPAHIESIVDAFKRSYNVDKETGQLDLKANFLSQNSDFFIPFREGMESKIEALPSASNPTQMDDIKYVQNKVLTAIRTPKAFINFDGDSSPGEGKNLSLLDVRFTITIKRLQQTLIMELNKIAQIHLMMLGFNDDLMNFTLTMNNPSSQAEMLEIENIGKKIQVAKDAGSDVGGGIPLCSLQWIWKNIMHWSDSEISENLNNIRLEKALGFELENTQQIIRRTGVFNPVDNIYGEPNADYQMGGGGQEGGPEGEGGPGGFGGGGGGLDFGDEGMAVGGEGEMPMGDAMGAEPGGETEGPDIGGAPGPESGGPNESVETVKPLLTEEKVKRPKLNKPNKSILEENIPLYDKTFFINEEMDKMTKSLSEYISTHTK